MNKYDILVRPIVTEKSYALIEERRYTFEIAKGANKTAVKQAVETIFGVKVEKVNIINGVRKRRKVGRYEGLRPAVRKAVVTLAEGEKLDVFEM